ncbi:MAG: pentapeptide repeat-containing protein [Bacteriovoracaceae bacterium]
MKNRECTLTVEDESIAGIVALKLLKSTAEFHHCIFTGCDLSNANLSGRSFIECEFFGSNFALANVSGASFRSVTFKECKLSGVRFDQCNAFLFTVRFEGCILDRASLYRLKAKKTQFIKCSLKETDLSECDLSGSEFDLCNLERTIFDRTNLERADFRTAYNYSIDPEKNRITKAKFSSAGVAGLLDKYDIVIEM